MEEKSLWSLMIDAGKLLGLAGAVLYTYGFAYFKSYLFVFDVSFFVSMPVELALRTGVVGFLTLPFYYDRLILLLIVLFVVVGVFLATWKRASPSIKKILLIVFILLPVPVLACSAIMRAKEERTMFKKYLNGEIKEELFRKPHVGHAKVYLKREAAPRLAAEIEGFLLAESDQFLTLFCKDGTVLIPVDAIEYMSYLTPRRDDSTRAP
jgi:multisubunit Na+/H+ antiporter MnhG subunit